MSRSKKTNPSQPVSLISDPYNINTQEIADAQNSADPIAEENLDEFDDQDTEECDEPIRDEDVAFAKAEEIAEKMDKLAIAMAEEDERHTEELIATAQVEGEGESEEEAAARLKQEIEEDQALQAELAQADAEETAADPELQAALPRLDDVQEVQSAIEALLFVSDRPISLKKLHELLGPDAPYSIFQEAITELKDRYARPEFGIEPVEVSGGIQFRTKAGRAALVRKLAKVQTRKLSTGAMETLAIVAYRQPVMKEDIDEVRGVDSSYFVRGLLDQKLIAITGRSELPGRPMLYSTTDDFLQIFGLKDLQALPPLAELERMLPASEAGKKDEDDPRIIQMRKLVSQMTADKSVSLLYDPREDEKILKEIKERVSDISTTTPYLHAQDNPVAAEEALPELPHPPVPEGAQQPPLGI